MKDQIEAFDRFLSKNRAKRKFYRNLRPLSPEDHFRLCLSRHRPGEFISSAFIFRSTREGRIYWEVLNEKWHLTLDQQQ